MVHKQCNPFWISAVFSGSSSNPGTLVAVMRWLGVTGRYCPVTNGTPCAASPHALPPAFGTTIIDGPLYTQFSRLASNRDRFPEFNDAEV